jgi:hypothetical protein
MHPILRSLTVLSFVSPITAAQGVVSEPEFVGVTREDFEGAVLGSQLEAFTEMIGGKHMIAIPQPVHHVFGIAALSINWDITNTVNGCILTDPLGFQFLAQTPDFYTFGSDEIDFVFSSPVERFGGEIADLDHGGVGGTFEVEIYDEDLNLIHFEQTVNPSGCEWNWHGWRATGAKMSRVRLRALDVLPQPPFMMYDNLDLDCADCFASIYCGAKVNSSGEMASIWVTGSPSLAQNDLVLRAGRVPADKVGIFFFGPSRISVPFGNGIKCVGGGTKRLLLTTAQGEVLRHDVDFTGGSAANITTGSTYNFQAWFRDPAAGGSSTNLSSALSITFQP